MLKGGGDFGVWKGFEKGEWVLWLDEGGWMFLELWMADEKTHGTSPAVGFGLHWMEWAKGWIEYVTAVPTEGWEELEVARTVLAVACD
jgi:hypothetical protein